MISEQVVETMENAWGVMLLDAVGEHHTLRRCDDGS